MGVVRNGKVELGWGDSTSQLTLGRSPGLWWTRTTVVVGGCPAVTDWKSVPRGIGGAFQIARSWSADFREIE